MNALGMLRPLIQSYQVNEIDNERLCAMDPVSDARTSTSSESRTRNY